MSERHLNDHCNLVLIQYCRPYRSVPYCPVAVVVQSIFMETISSFFLLIHLLSLLLAVWPVSLSLIIVHLQSSIPTFLLFTFCSFPLLYVSIFFFTIANISATKAQPHPVLIFSHHQVHPFFISLLLLVVLICSMI